MVEKWKKIQSQPSRVEGYFGHFSATLLIRHMKVT